VDRRLRRHELLLELRIDLVASRIVRRLACVPARGVR
jgi:hypothetical protein